MTEIREPKWRQMLEIPSYLRHRYGRWENVKAHLRSWPRR